MGETGISKMTGLFLHSTLKCEEIRKVAEQLRGTRRAQMGPSLGSEAGA